MLPPLFLHEVDGDELMVFSDARSAAYFLEPELLGLSQDVFYDSVGRLLSWNCSSQTGLVFQDAEAIPTHQQRLRDVIVRNLVRRGMRSEEIAYLALPELVKIAARYSE